MHAIAQVKTDTRERVTIVHRKDLEVSYFCGSGKGGQAKNKVASGVMIRHPESGAMGRASDSRSLEENKRAAFDRLLKDPRMKFYIAKEIYRVQTGETMQESVDRECDTDNLKFEIKDDAGQWMEVPASHFDNPSSSPL